MSNQEEIDKHVLEAKKEMLLSIQGLSSCSCKHDIDDCWHCGERFEIALRDTWYRNTCCEEKRFACPDCMKKKSIKKELHICDTEYPKKKERTFVQYKLLTLEDIDPLTVLMKQLPKLCQYKSNGCDEAYMLCDDMEDHEVQCPYRSTICADLKCNQKIPFIELMDHFNSEHKEFQVEIGTKFSFELPVPHWFGVDKSSFTNRQVNVFGRTFFLVTVFDDPVSMWVYLYGDRDEAKKYFYHIRIRNGMTGQELSAFEQVRSIDESATDVIKNGDAFTNKISKLRKFNVRCKERLKHYVTFDIEIRNMKEEAKDSDVESGISD